jgi:predicted metal-dependent phosphoesterase TrpH
MWEFSFRRSSAPSNRLIPPLTIFLYPPFPIFFIKIPGLLLHSRSKFRYFWTNSVLRLYISKTPRCISFFRYGPGAKFIINRCSLPPQVPTHPVSTKFFTLCLILLLTLQVIIHMNKPSTISYTVKAELHCHTGRKLRLSYFPLIYESVQTEMEVLNVCIRKNIRILAITDHNSLDGYFITRDIIARNKLPIILIPACEITSADGHILAYNINHLIPPSLPAKETINRIHQQGGIAIAPHPFNNYPFFGKKLSLSELIYELPFEGLEIYNASMSGRSNPMAASAALKLGLPGIAGSDAHLPSEVGRSLTLFPPDTDSVPKLLKYLTAGNFSILPGHSPVIQMFVSLFLYNIKSRILHR